MVWSLLLKHDCDSSGDKGKDFRLQGQYVCGHGARGVGGRGLKSIWGAGLHCWNMEVTRNTSNAAVELGSGHGTGVLVGRYEGFGLGCSLSHREPEKGCKQGHDNVVWVLGSSLE